MVFVGPTAPLTWMQILRSCHPPMLPEDCSQWKGDGLWFCNTYCAAQDMVKECTFQPVTTWRSLSRATTAAKERLEASTSLNSNTSDAALNR